MEFTNLSQGLCRAIAEGGHRMHPTLQFEIIHLVTVLRKYLESLGFSLKICVHLSKSTPVFTDLVANFPDLLISLPDLLS
ncbi:hypothetical protein Syun_030266 [Stephania yunnanensis]|uniref:Uncharacterized protein n=1 Tax=Stephania yunnanensis TaxID=152371 RepID=A0AAP0EBP3_9MAGN